MLLPLARSRLHPYKNIINNIHIWELFNNLRFYQAIFAMIFPSQQQQQSKDYKDHLVFSQYRTAEEFYSPTEKYQLNQTELRKMKEHFSVYYNVAKRTNVEEDSVGLQSFSKYGAHEFIDACAIDHCVGFFNHNGIYYIIDKEFEYFKI